MTYTILVGFDGQGSSTQALRWAVQRAKDRDGSVTAAWVVDAPRPPIGSFDHAEAMRAAAKDILERQIADARAAAPGVPITSVVVNGHVVEELRRLSQGVDLVVVGTNRSLGVLNLVQGTRSIKIAATSEAPVVVVPDLDLSGRTGVLVGVDGSEASERAIAFAAAEADRLGQPLRAVHVWSLPRLYGHDYVPPPDTHDVFREAAMETTAISLAGLAGQYPDLEVQREVVEGEPLWAMVERSKSASLVVVGSRGRGPIRRLLLGSVSHGLLLNLTAPTAVVR